MKIRPLAEHDLGAAQRLREQAGWNQTEDDWRRLLAWSPDGCWVAELDGQVIGTTTVTTYGRRIAWVGMVLVDVEHRRRGIGQALLTQAVAYLERIGVQTIALDSTPEGQPLYARLGFVDAFDLARWRGPSPPARPSNSPVHPVSSSDRGDPRRLVDSDHEPSPLAVDVAIRPLEAPDLAAVSAYDARQFGTDRAHILEALRGGNPGACFVATSDQQVVGYGLGRPGARARHLGPLAADDPRTADRLARAVLGSLDAPRTPRTAAPDEMVMDVVMPNVDAVSLATALGLTAVRRFIRMTRGAPPPAVDTGHLYTSAGPELG